MGLSQSKKKESTALTVVATPTSVALPTTPTSLDLNQSLSDTAALLSQDSEWLDDNEMRAMEDEDAMMVRELSATNTGELSLNEWLKTREADTKMSIKIVGTSTLSKFMGRKTVEYTIETDTGTVKRRFKDFAALRYGLEVRFPGAFVAPLPAKKQFGKTEPLFLVKRKRLLQLFLQSVARHPFLSADDLFVEFIASTARFDRKAAWRQRTWLVKAQKWSVAARRWAQALIEAETLPNPQATMEAAAGELSQVQKHLQSLKTSLKRNAYAASAFSESLHDVSAGFQKSGQQEMQMVLFSGAEGTTAEPLTRVYGQGQALVTQTGEIMRKYPDALDEAILSPIRFEMQVVETYQEALRRTKFSIARHRQAVSAYRQAREQTELGSFRNGVQLAVQAEIPADGTSPPQTAQLLTTVNHAEIDKQRKRLQRMRLTAVQAQMNARRDINGILVIELQRFRLERQLRMNKSFADYMTVQKSQAENIASVWAHGLSNAPAVSTQMQAVNAHHEMVAESSSRNDEQPSRIEPPHTLASQDSSFVDNSAIMSPDDYPKTRRASQLRAKYPFQGMHEDELDVNEGEILEGTVDDHNPEWVRAKSLTTGKEGLVPKTYVEELAENGNEDDDEDDEDDEDNNMKKPAAHDDLSKGGDPTNFIKQTQDMFKGTKRSNADREQL